MSKAKAISADPLLVELVAIKRLIIFSLLNSGVTQKQIATALGVDQSQVSRMFPTTVGAAARGPGKGK